MTTSTQKQLCGDNLNIFGHVDQNFWWTRAYWYYSSPLATQRNENGIWTSEIAFVGCVPKVFDCKEIVAWCVEKYIPNQMAIQLQGHAPICLSPQVFL
jgi:hypothetical protein